MGFGGYCLPKDLKSFIHIGEGLGVDMALMRAAEGINLKRVERLVDKLRKALWVVKGKSVAVWGLSFKPETDDIREAPSLKVVSRLLADGAVLRLYDPRAMETFRRHFPDDAHKVTYCSSAEEAVQDADALVLLTEWAEFREKDFAGLSGRMSQPIIVDGRNFLPGKTLRGLGFEYYGMGR